MQSAITPRWHKKLLESKFTRSFPFYFHEYLFRIYFLTAAKSQSYQVYKRLYLSLSKTFSKFSRTRTLELRDVRILIQTNGLHIDGSRNGTGNRGNISIESSSHSTIPYHCDLCNFIQTTISLRFQHFADISMTSYLQIPAGC